MTPSRANPIWFPDIAKAYLITSLFFLIFGKLKQRSSLIVFINNLIIIIKIIIIIIII